MSSGSRLREALDGGLDGAALIAPGVYDALTALLVEQAGFGCAYVSGASVSFTRIGRPDLGLTTLTELADTVANMRERVELPLVVDADTGFGNALNTRRSVRLLERMGASGIQLEDQTSPKRCGHLEGKSLVDVAEMKGKIKAAVDARHDQDTLIIARTDALALDGIDQALERGAAYAEAGADMLFIESPRNRDELERIGAELGVRTRLLCNMVEGGKTPLLPAQELGDLGFDLVIYPGAMVRVVSFAAQAYLQELQAVGTTAGMLERMNQFDQIMDIVGLQESIDEGQAYSPEILSAR
jgi:2-methylisocitrate lyase-like PEP mutase family enzyme